jgi:hypothetical protein
MRVCPCFLLSSHISLCPSLSLSLSLPASLFLSHSFSLVRPSFCIDKQCCVILLCIILYLLVLLNGWTRKCNEHTHKVNCGQLCGGGGGRQSWKAKLKNEEESPHFFSLCSTLELHRVSSSHFAIPGDVCLSHCPAAAHRFFLTSLRERSHFMRWHHHHAIISVLENTAGKISKKGDPWGLPSNSGSL